MRQIRNLCLREDVILGRILAQLGSITGPDDEIRQEIARLQHSGDAAELVGFLRNHGITIECLTTSVSFGVGHEKLAVAGSSTNALERDARIPQ